MIWDSFESLNKKQKGDVFENLCHDLLGELGFNLERQSNEGGGGADGGQDLIILEPDPLSKKLIPTCVVECKYRGANTIGGADIWSPLLAVMELNVPSLLIMTSWELTGPLKARLRSISQNSKWGISLRKLERGHIEALLNEHPKITKKYFPNEPSTQENDIKIRNLEPIIADLKAATKLKNNGKRNVQITIHNTESTARSVTIESEGQKSTQLLEAFQEKTVLLEVDANESGESVQVCDEHTKAQFAKLQSTPPVVSVSHIFVDPFNYIDKITNAINKGMTVLLSGKAGSGKSRIIAELLSTYSNGCKIDLSQNSYENGLIELLLEEIFSMPISEVRELPDEFIKKYLGKNANLSEVALNTLSIYIRREKVADHGFAEAAARLCTEWFHDNLLAIDNIHRLTLFDLDFLKTLSRTKKDMRLILATRSEEVDIKELETLTFINQHSGPKWKSFVIDESNTQRLLETYIDKTAKDDVTRGFLKPWTNIDTVQKFVLALKKLKAAGVLKQNLDGKFRILSLQGAHPSQQREIFTELKVLISDKLGNNLVEETLAAAAIFGFHFPVGFIEERIGTKGLQVLNRLEQLDIISSNELVNGELWMKFDHETTAQIAKQLVPSTLAFSLHKDVLGYICHESRYRNGHDDRKVGEHLYALGQYLKAAKKYHSYAQHQSKRGWYSDSLTTLRQAKSIIDKVDDILEAERLALEITIIHDFLECSLIGSASRDRRWKMLGAYKLALRLSGKELAGRYAGRYWFFKAKLERQNNPQLAEESMRKSLEIYGALYPRDRAESHAWFSNFLKKYGHERFLEATYHARRALFLARRCDEPVLRSRCLLHAGALYLEAGKPSKTPWWWSRAVDILSGTKDIGMLAFALADAAYVKALIQPEDHETYTSLLESLALSKQFDLDGVKIRSAINIANWSYYHGNQDESCLQYIDLARDALKKIHDPYKEALLDFTCLNFAKHHDKWKVDEITDKAISFLESWFQNQDKTTDGDVRIRNMISFFIANKNERILALVNANKNIGNSHWDKLLQGFELTDLEKGNPYYISQHKSYATYY